MAGRQESSATGPGRLNASPGGEQRLTLLRRGLRLEYATLGWNVVGIVVSLVAAVAARSVALAGFALDSGVEIFASLVVVGELKGTSDAAGQQPRRASHRLRVPRARRLPHGTSRGDGRGRRASVLVTTWYRLAHRQCRRHVCARLRQVTHRSGVGAPGAASRGKGHRHGRRARHRDLGRPDAQCRCSAGGGPTWRRVRSSSGTGCARGCTCSVSRPDGTPGSGPIRAEPLARRRTGRRACYRSHPPWVH